MWVLSRGCWLGVARHAKSHPDMPRLTRGESGCSVHGMATLEVIWNERLLEF